jgi:hypothetical protein
LMMDYNKIHTLLGSLNEEKRSQVCEGMESLVGITNDRLNDTFSQLFSLYHFLKSPATA